MCVCVCVWVGGCVCILVRTCVCLSRPSGRSGETHCSVSINQSIKGSPHKATHGQWNAAFQHYHRGQQTLRHEVTQAWGAVTESQQDLLACATHSFSTPFTVACAVVVSVGVGCPYLSRSICHSINQSSGFRRGSALPVKINLS